MTTEPSGHSGAASSGTPRTLADALRVQSDEALAGLLRARPDLISPVPNDLTQLATRAGARTSVVRALERLDHFALATAQAMAVAPDPCPYPVLAALLAAGDDEAEKTSGATAGARAAEGAEATEAVADALPRALALLRERAVVWGEDDRLRLVRTARELLAPTAGNPSATGLGPTLAEATSGMSPGRLQEILAAAGLPTTHDPVSAIAALTDLFTDRPRMAALLEQAPRAATDMLAKLMWGPPYGTLTSTAGLERTNGLDGSGNTGTAGPGRRAPGADDRPEAAIRWLLERGLLLPSGPRTLVLPREVALHLRGGRAHRTLLPLAPEVEPRAGHSPRTVDSTAAGQALSALATVEELLKQWETAGPPVLRAGGLGVRELKRTAVALDVAEPVAAFWIELAYAAGLLASDGEADERYAPTPAYDEWLRQPPERQWAVLATAWLTATRTAGLVGTRDAKGRALTALGPGLDRSAAPETRRRVLELLADLPEGSAPEPETMLARLHWERPLRTADELRERLCAWTLSEAELLGVTGRGALAAHGRALLAPGGPPSGPQGLPAREAGALAPAGEAGAPAPPVGRVGAPHSAAAPSAVARPTTLAPPPSGHPGHPGHPPTGRAVEAAAAAGDRAATRLAPLLPEPLDHILPQADLTAVAPGPLKRPLAEMLGVLADVESKGGATVYRFTPGSVRRALDSGRTAAELHAFLREHSRTPVPQPLTYLIDDVSRRHGRLRVGAASSYVRCDDDALLAEILADRRGAALGLRRLAPTVLAADTAPEVLLARLREMGYAPAAESAEGDVLIARAAARRTPPRSAPEPVPDGPPEPDHTLLSAAVRAIRAGDHTSAATRKPTLSPAVRREVGSRPLPRTTSADTLAALQSATLTGSALWIGCVNADGTTDQRLISPVRVEAGFVTAYDHTADEVRTYPLHRITGTSDPTEE